LDKLTAIIPAGNEAHNIEAAIRSVLWADEVFVVVDAASTDGTEAAARAVDDPKVRVVVHPYESPAAQKNWAIPQAAHPWVFLLDADERPEPALVEKVRALLGQDPEADAYWIYRTNIYLGRPLRWGGAAHDRVVRLFGRECRYRDVRVHEEVELAGKRVAEVRGAYLLHDTVRDWEHWQAKNDLYARWGAEQLFAEGQRAGFASIVLRPLHRFLKQYLFRLGFLDGIPGAAVAYMGAYGVFLKYARLWSMHRGWPKRVDRQSSNDKR
jgi:glycosyltransferase involved in cell wall biosynthesis